MIWRALLVCLGLIAGGWTHGLVAFPNDVVSGAKYWYGLRAYSSASRGSALINVCNVSDAACADMSSNATTGALVVTTIGGSNCSVVVCTIKTWYDQGSGAKNITQATIGSRPTLKIGATNCNGLPVCADFAGVAGNISSGAATQAQPFTMSFYGVRTGAAAFTSVFGFDDGVTTFAYVTFAAATGQVEIAATASLFSGACCTEHAWNSVSGVLNGASSITIAGLGGTNGQIATSADLGGGNWVGTAFGGGGYFEATLKFDPTVVNTANGWPSFWSMAIEHLAQTSGQQWTGQAAGYSHFIEADFFEYDISNGIPYIGVLHDWYGIFNSTCPPGYCSVTSASVRPGIVGIDWNVYHRVGMLWIPATAGTSGSATFYLDDIQQGSPVSWSQFTNQSPPPTGATPWTYGVIDGQHLAIMLGTGVNQFLTVSAVKVWQTSAAGNIVH